MSSERARQILILYRPGTADGEDPEVARALAMVARDPELLSWFKEQCELCKAFRDKFRQLPVQPLPWMRNGDWEMASLRIRRITGDTP
jgi:hypothetical protein